MASQAALRWMRKETPGLGAEATSALKMYLCLYLEIFGKRASHDHRNHLEQKVHKGFCQLELNDPLLSLLASLLQTRTRPLKWKN